MCGCVSGHKSGNCLDLDKHGLSHFRQSINSGAFSSRLETRLSLLEGRGLRIRVKLDDIGKLPQEVFDYLREARVISEYLSPNFPIKISDRYPEMWVAIKFSSLNWLTINFYETNYFLRDWGDLHPRNPRRESE